VEHKISEFNVNLQTDEYHQLFYSNLQELVDRLRNQSCNYQWPNIQQNKQTTHRTNAKLMQIQPALCLVTKTSIQISQANGASYFEWTKCEKLLEFVCVFLLITFMLQVQQLVWCVLCVYEHVCVCACVYACVRVCVCMHVCVCIHVICYWIK